MSTWVMKDNPDTSVEIDVTINFISNTTSFNRIWVGTGNPINNDNEVVYGLPAGGYNMAYYSSDSAWTNDGYKTLIFNETEPTGELLTWLQLNGTKSAIYGGILDSIVLNDTDYDLEDSKTHPVIMTTSDSQVSGIAIDLNGATGADIWAAYDQGTPIKVIDTNRRLVYNCVGYTVSGSSRIFNFTSTNSGTYHYFTLWLSEAAASGLINAPGSMDSVKKTTQALSSIGLSGTTTVTLSDGYSILNLVFPLQGRYVSTAIPADSLTTTAVPVQVADQVHYAVWNVSRSGNKITFVFNRKYSGTSQSLTGMIYESQ